MAQVHCYLLCTEGEIRVSAFEGKTTVNSVEMADGRVQLAPTNVLVIGSVQLVACGFNVMEAPQITGTNLGELIDQATEYHGSPARAAKAFNVKQRTFYRWIETKKFHVAAAAGIIAIGIVGGAMLYPGTSVESHTTLLPAATSITAPAPAVPATKSEAPVDATNRADSAHSDEQTIEPVTLVTDEREVPSIEPRRYRTRKTKTATPANQSSPEQRFLGGQGGTDRGFLGGSSDIHDEPGGQE